MEPFNGNTGGYLLSSVLLDRAVFYIGGDPNQSDYGAFTKPKELQQF